MARGDHTQDPLSKTTLLGGSPWYNPAGRDYLSPSTLYGHEPKPEPEPARERPPPGQHRKKGPPQRRVNPRYVTAAVCTALLAVPALYMADYIATHNGNEQQIELVNRDAHIPMTLFANDKREPICVYIQNGQGGWKAWATSEPC